MTRSFAIEYTLESRREGMKKLLQLADFLDKLPDERFDFGVWVGSDWKGDPKLTCGTTACAAGWATTIWHPQLYLTHWQEVATKRPAFDNDDELYEVRGFDALTYFFNLTVYEARLLFVPFDQFEEVESDRFPDSIEEEEIQAFVSTDFGFEVRLNYVDNDAKGVAHNIREFAKSRLERIEKDDIALVE